MCSDTAQARPKPSYVEVPRPSSSMRTREAGVAELRMAWVSTISAMKVDTPSSWQSEAPILTITESITLISALSAATKLPH